MRRLTRRTVVQVVVLLLVAAGAPVALLTASPAHATPTCTKDWVGPSGTTWNAAGSWSPVGVPSATDVVCAGAGSHIDADGMTVAAIVSQGRIDAAFPGGLHLLGPDASTIFHLEVTGQPICPADCPSPIEPLAPLTVTGTLGSSAVRFETSGSCPGVELALTVPGPFAGVIESTNCPIRNTASLALAPNTPIVLAGTGSFLNQGTLRLAEGDIVTDQGANTHGQFVNDVTGTIVVDTATDIPAWLQLAQIRVPFDNNGLVQVLNGEFRSAGKKITPTSAHDGTWQTTHAGDTITFESSSQSLSPATQFSGPGHVKVASSTVNLDGVSLPNLVVVGGTLTGSGTVTGPALLQSLTVSGDITFAPDVVVTSNSVPGIDVRNGTLTNKGTIPPPTGVANHVSVYLAVYEGGTFRNEGTVAGVLLAVAPEAGANASNGPTGTMTFSNPVGDPSESVSALMGPFTNEGTVVFASGRVRVDDYHQISGSTTVAPSATLGRGFGQKLRFSGGLLRGGSVFGALTIEGTARVEPGQSPGLLVQNGGNVSFGGVLGIEVGGPDRGTGYDAVDVAGNTDGGAVLGGALEIALTGGYEPSPGQRFAIVTSFWELAGEFASATGLDLPGPYRFELEYLPNEVDLVVVDDIGPGTGFHSVTPYRAFDSRQPGPSSGAIGPHATRAVTIAGAPGAAVPASATAVVMNVTVTGATAGSYLTVSPAGAPVPLAANLNFTKGQTVPNLVTVKVGSAGKVAFTNANGSVHVIADVVGWFDDGSSPGARFNAVTPTRILDSRTAIGDWNNKLGANQSRNLHVAGVNGIPSTATAAVMNVSVTQGSAASFLQAYPAGASRPLTANLLFGAGQSVPNLVTVGIGANGDVAFYNQLGSVHVIVDVVGYFDSTGALFHPLTPLRLLDSRTGVGGYGSKWQPHDTRSVIFAGRPGIPDSATGLVMNTTVTAGTQGSYLTLYPNGPANAGTANLLFGAGQTVPNLVMVGIGDQGKVAIFNFLGQVHVIGDVAGYFAAT